MSESIAVVNNERRHRFEVARDGEVGFLTYRHENGTIQLVHTEVPESISGHGVAASLASGAFDYARSHGLRVIVICRYVAKWLERHPEQRDIVDTLP